MNPHRSILLSNINTWLGAALILSCGILFLTIGFRITHMENPILDALEAQEQASS